ncbi:MAG: putative nucleotide-diphospho-sugar transferase [Qingshengfaniella sp.]
MTTPVSPAPRGVVLAASGRRYVTLARQTAESIAATCPGLPVDLFTDGDTDPGPFAQVHKLDRSWFRPKFEALVRSRFERTLYMDVDIVVVGDLSDVFDILDRFDIAATHVQNRNQSFAMRPWRKPLPNAFPQINGGLMAVKRSADTDALFQAVQQALIEENLPQDQPVLRELLYDSDLRLAILPPEYNLRDRTLWRFSGSKLPAPRVLHNTAFITRMTDDGPPPSPDQIYGRWFMRHVRKMIAADRQLTPGTRARAAAPFDIPGQIRDLLRR